MNGLILATAMSDWVSAISTLAAVMVALVVVVFGDELRTWRRKPKLWIEAGIEEPFVEKTAIQTTIARSRVFYFRIRISNRGRSAATNVEVHVTQVSKEMEGGSFSEVPSFVPLPLSWTYLTRNGDPVTALPRLASGVSAYCDLFRIADPEFRRAKPLNDDHRQATGTSTVISLCTVPRPNSQITVFPPGQYKLKGVITADGITPIPFAVLARSHGTFPASVLEIAKHFGMSVCRSS